MGKLARRVKRHRISADSWLWTGIPLPFFFLFFQIIRSHLFPLSIRPIGLLLVLPITIPVFPIARGECPEPYGSQASVRLETAGIGSLEDRVQGFPGDCGPDIF